jgi:DNA-directed RNA polymerase subunit beta'
VPETFGQYLLNQAIPEPYRPKGAFTKKELQKNMLRLAKDDPEQYVKTISEVKRWGDEFATLEGISVGLDDIQPLYKERNAIVKPALRKIQRAKNPTERRKLIADTQDKLIEHAATHPGTMGMMARSGARGNVLQLMRTVGAPAAASDEHGKIQPWLTTHSYAEGLRPSEWWANNREARMAAVKANIEVTEPGDLSKILVNNTSDQVVTASDCGTRNGIPMPPSDPSILDRYTARPYGTVTANTLVTPRVVSELKKQKIDRVLVRSPMTCEAHEGLCQQCTGLNTIGKLNPLGENVGIRASQALGEPLTQLALNVKHGVRVSGQDPKEVGGLAGFRALLESPASFRNKASLAPVNGTITSITKAPQGGHYINVNTERIYVPQGLDPIVKEGQTVNSGDALSEGTPRPDEVVKYKGLGAGRDYLVGRLSKIYKDSGIDVDRRHFEVLAKSTMNYLKIDDIDDDTSADTGFVRGDVVDYNRFRNIVAKSVNTVPLNEAEGKPLGESVLHHLAGTRVTPQMINEFRRAGITSIKVSLKAPEVSPVLAPATRNPLLNPDWMVRLGHRYLKQSILEGAHRGDKSNLHGAHPIPGLIFSSEFGEGGGGKY